MMLRKRAIVAGYLLLSMTVLSGCGGSNEVGPADPSKVPTVDPAVVEKEIHRDESKKHLPKGAEIPPGVVPKDQPTQ